MSEATSRTGLILPGGGSSGRIRPDDQLDIDKLNENFRTIDRLLGANVVVSESAYSATGFPGQLLFQEDTQQLIVRSSLNWQLLGNYYVGPKSRRTQTHSRYGVYWQDSDEEKRLYIGNTDGSWRRAAGKIIVPATSWAASTGSHGSTFIGSRQLDITIPSKLETTEKILFGTESVGASHAFYSYHNVKREASSSIVTVRITQVISSESRSGYANWLIVP